MTLELVPLAEISVQLALPVLVPDTPIGTLAIVDVTAIDVRGDRIRATQRGAAAADWLTVGPDGIGTLDVRATVETDDGAIVYSHYRGRIDISKGNHGAIVYAAPLYETGDPRYAWLTRIQAVAKGVVTAHEDGTSQLDYEVYELR